MAWAAFEPDAVFAHGADRRSPQVRNRAISDLALRYGIQRSVPSIVREILRFGLSSHLKNRLYHARDCL